MKELHKPTVVEWLPDAITGDGNVFVGATWAKCIPYTLTEEERKSLPKFFPVGSIGKIPVEY